MTTRRIRCVVICGCLVLGCISLVAGLHIAYDGTPIYHSRLPGFGIVDFLLVEIVPRAGTADVRAHVAIVNGAGGRRLYSVVNLTFATWHIAVSTGLLLVVAMTAAPWPMESASQSD